MRVRTLRSHLMVLVVVSIVPLLLFTVLVIALFERQQRGALERSFRDTTRSLTVAVDHELTSSISTLKALATSEHLDAGDLRRFYEQARRALATHPGWVTINLADATGHQLVNLQRPFGEALPFLGGLDVVRRTLDTREPAISNLFVGLVLKVPVVGVSVPVIREGDLRYVLGARLDVAALSRLLAEGHLPAGWVATIIDRDGIIVARTRAIEELVGKPATSEFVAQSRRAWDGSFRDVTRDGASVYGAYSRSRLSGWTVGLGVPAAAVEGPAHVTLFTILGGGAAVLLLAGGLSIRFGRRIATAIGSLSSSARALGRGEAPSAIGRATISEVADLEAEMVAAARERAEVVETRAKIEEALRDSEERTRLIVSHALDAVITADAQGRITTWNPQAERLFGWSRDEALGRRLSETIIPPAYREAHERGLAHFLATGEGPVLGRRMELTALRRDGTAFPIELAITPMRIGSDTVFSAFVRDISERKDAEEVRRRSEASFRLLFAGNPLPMWVYDLETLYFLEVNDAAVSHYGYTREEFLRMRIKDIRPPEEVARFEARIAEVAAAPRAIPLRSTGWRHRLKDGRIREIEIDAHALEFGGRRAILVVARDVTELKQAQAARARTNARLDILHEIDRRIIAAEVPAAIAEAVLGPLSTLLGVPRVIVNLFDLEAGEAEWLAAVGRRRMHIGPGVRFSLELMGDVAGLGRGEVQVIRSAALPASAAKSALLASGVENYMVVPMNAGGELIGAVSFGGPSSDFPPEQVGIAQEVATQLAIAIAQARLRERVQRQADRLGLLHEIDRSIIAAETPEAMAAAVLPRLRDLLGVPRAIVNLFDLEAGEVEWLAAAGRRRVRVGPGVRYSLRLAGDLEALRRGEPQVVDIDALPPSPEVDALGASGIRSYMVVPMIAAGELIGSVSLGTATSAFPPEQIGIAQEVATQLAIALAQARLRERVQHHAEELEERVRARTAELEAAQEQLVRSERLAILGQLAGGVSHELRNPLGVIKNSVYYLNMVLPEEAMARKHLGIVEREIAAADRIVTGLLDFARVTPANRVAIDVNRTVREYLDRKPLPANVVPVIMLPDGLLPVLADAGQVELILGNLVTNAAQAMPDGGTLTVETAAVDGGVRLTVDDTGKGISAEDLGKIFEPLFTTKAKGIGLGLSVARRLARANGAEITVASEPGRGSRFEVRFSLTPPAAP